MESPKKSLVFSGIQSNHESASEELHSWILPDKRLLQLKYILNQTAQIKMHKVNDIENNVT